MGSRRRPTSFDNSQNYGLRVESSDPVWIAVAVAAALSVVALAVAIIAVRRGTRARDRYRRVAGSDRDVVDVLLDRVSAIDANRLAVEKISAVCDAIREDLAHSIRHLSVVRYDAFRDLGGRRSFSAALLDDHGDGLVLTNLCGRSDSQTIAKGIKAGDASGLSAEEAEAVQYAMGGRKS